MTDELFMRAKKNDPNRPRHCREQSVISDVGSDDGIQGAVLSIVPTVTTATYIKMDEKEEEKECNIDSKPTRIRIYEQIEMQLQTLRNGEEQELQDQRKAHEKELAHFRDNLKSEHEAHIEKLVRDHQSAMKKVKQQLEELSAASLNRGASTTYKALLKRLSVFKGPSMEYRQPTEREIDGNMSKDVTNESYSETSEKFEDDDGDDDNNGVDEDSKDNRGAAEGGQDGPSVDRDDQGPSGGQGSIGTDHVDTEDGKTKDAHEHSDKKSAVGSDIVIPRRKKLVERIRMYEQIEMQLQTLRNGEEQELQDQKKAHEKELAHVRDPLESEHDAHLEKLVSEHENAMKKVKQHLGEQCTESAIDDDVSKKVTNESYSETSDKFKDDGCDDDTNGVGGDIKGGRRAAEGEPDGPSVNRDDQGPSEGEGSMGTDPVDTVEGETKDALEQSDKESAADGDIVVYGRKKPVEMEMVECSNRDYKKRFLGDIFKANHVDVKEKEIRDMQACVHDVLRNSVKSDPDVCDVILCGSMAEGTRIWEYERYKHCGKMYSVPVVEFDFLAVLNWSVTMNEDTQAGELRVTNGPYPGYKRVEPDVSSSIFRRRPGEFEIECLKRFRKHVSNNFCGTSRLSLEEKQADDHSIKYQFIWKPFGLKPTATYKDAHGDTLEDTCLINVDFMPAFRYQEPNEASPCLLVPKREPRRHVMPVFPYQEPNKASPCLLVPKREPRRHVMPVFPYQEPNEASPCLLVPKREPIRHDMPVFPYQEPNEASPCLLVPKRERRRHLMPAFRYEGLPEARPIPMPGTEYPKLDEGSQFVQQPRRPFHDLERERNDESHWYLMQSYCREEIQTLIDTSQVHRDVFMLLKSFNKHIGMDAIPAYHLKTAVLRHIEKCQEPDLVDCSRDSLLFLHECYSMGELLTLRGQIDLLVREPDVVKKRITQIPHTILHAFEKILHGKSDDKEYNFKHFMDDI